ncbi:MAG: c-type cytochrome [Acidobacteriota bacterium]
MSTQRLGILLLALVSTCGSAVAYEVDTENGMELYQKYCSQCHGVEGNADGPAAQFVLPRPRPFAGNTTFKFRSTPSGSLPQSTDIYRVIWEGIPGTSMPAFSNVLSEEDCWDLTAVIWEWGGDDFQDPEQVIDATKLDLMPDAEFAGEVWDILNELSSEPIPPSAESLKRGEEVYIEAQCAKCHGVQGFGDGESWIDTKDEWGEFILPANLANPESFRNGRTPADIFRTITTGLNGTPMPAYRDTYSVEDRWHLVNYIIEMGPENPGEKSDAIVAYPAPDGVLPAENTDEAWADYPQARFPTFANVIEAPRLYWQAVEYVMAQASYNDLELVLRFQWDDRGQSEGTDDVGDYKDRDGRIHHLTNHPDQFVIQWPLNKDPDGKRPYLMMGDNKRPAMLWWWRSDQEGVAEVEAKGFGNFSPQDDEPELVTDLQHADGRYSLMIRRTLATAGQVKDVEFAVDEFTPVAFSAWDGSRGEVGQRRALTSWYWLYLQPQMETGPASLKSLGVAGVVLLGLLGVWVAVRRGRNGNGAA